MRQPHRTRSWFLAGLFDEDAVFHLLLSREWFKVRVQHRLQFRQAPSGVTDDLIAGIPPEPISFAESGGRGYVFMANGLMGPLKWDGVQREADTVGVAAPENAPTISALGSYRVVQTFPAGPPPSGTFTRPRLIFNYAGFPGPYPPATAKVWAAGGWSDREWKYGDLPPKEQVAPGAAIGGFSASSTSGSHTATTTVNIPAGNGFYQLGSITRPPETTGGEGNLTGTYTAYVRFLDRDGNASGLSPISNEVIADRASAFQYSQVPGTDDPKVVLRQILRNTNGQAITYYVDVETDDLTSTDFYSTKTDEQLFTQEPVALFDAQGNSLGNSPNLPPNHKPCLALYGTRMFAAGDVVVTDGHAEVTEGSTTVTGVGTQWVRVLEGRLFYAGESGVGFEIQFVDVTAQTITLTTPYSGGTDPFALYTIATYPAVRRLVHWTEPGLPDSWPVSNAIEIEENGDLPTGLVVTDSFLLVLQKRHIYRMTFRTDPLVDGGVFLSAERGCINNRCRVLVDGTLYLMDEQGVYTLSPNGDAKGLSQGVQDLFQTNRPATGFRINWAASKHFHAFSDKSEGTVGWFVSLTGSRKPRHALCYSYITEQWWIVEYPFPIAASDNLASPNDRPMFGGKSRRLMASGAFSTDGPAPGSGSLAGVISSFGRTWLEDASATFPAVGLVGFPVAITEGRGKGQVRTVVKVVGTRIWVDRPWLVSPDTTSRYQLGAIPWRWRSSWFRWLQEETSSARRITLMFNKCAQAAKMDLEIYRDQSATPEVSAVNWPPTPAESDGVTVKLGEAAYSLDLTQDEGYVHVRVDDGQERYVWKPNLFALRLSGFVGPDRVRVYEMILEGATENVS